MLQKSRDTVRIASVTTRHQSIYCYRPTFAQFNKIQNNFNDIINFLMHKYWHFTVNLLNNTINNNKLLKKMLPQKPFRNLPQASATHEFFAV